MENKKIIFVCDTRDYHAMDWIHQVRALTPNCDILIASDIVIRDRTSYLANSDDKIEQLFNIGKLLFEGQSSISDNWRNLVKIVFTPFQIFGLIKLKKKFPDALFHAHSMYYIFISWLAGLKFIATPMGSDVLVRPEKSFLYRYFTKKSLHFAYGITVDSVRMMEKVRLLSGRDSELVQNGVDVRMISTFENNHIPRSEVVSIRGFYKNYQIDKIFDSRDQSSSHTPITFVYPFHDEIYQMDLQKRMQKFDRDLGRISRDHLYKLLSHTQLVVSIPESDSSPRSVYESIFSGCCVAVSYSDWVASLPSCMRGRTIIVNLDDKDWFVKAVNSAKEITRMPYIPSVEALKNFDQHETMKRVCHEIYHII